MSAQLYGTRAGLGSLLPHHGLRFPLPLPRWLHLGVAKWRRPLHSEGGMRGESQLDWREFYRIQNDFKLCDDDPLTVPNKCIDLRKCLPTCENPEPDRAFCDYDQQECSKQPLPRCVCRPGFVSQSDSGDGPCIKLEDCPKRRRVLPMPEPDGPPDVPLPLPPPSKETEE